MKLSRFSIVATLLLGSLMGHGGGCCEGGDEVFGPSTQTVCPPAGTALTYTNFGKPFMETYCTRCHASDKEGAARMGAPSFHDFDTLFGIDAVSDHIDQTTAAGPAATNDSMPPDGKKPSLAERQMLAEWIACGVPQ
ncbi:MAG TPA: hypothetical protein VK427_03760 [Kofleriaceae bacterium]|nr:hypothetical protein [Kofleriaceae bacterium]